MPNYVPIQDLTTKNLADTDLIPVSDGVSAYAVPASQFKTYTTEAAEAAAAAAEAAADRAEEEAPIIVFSPLNITSLMNDGFVRSSNGTISATPATFFYTDLITLRAGECLKISAKSSGTSVAWLSVWESESSTAGEVKQVSQTTVTEFTYYPEKSVEYVRLSNNRENNGQYPFVVQKGVVSYSTEFEQSVKEIVADTSEKVNVISVGTGKDFTTLNAAIASIADSSENNKYVIRLYPGTYETVVESEIVSGYKGLIIPDWVSIVGVGNRDDIIIQGTLPSASYAQYANDISTLNLTMNGSVENVTITAKNIRYCNHDDAGTFGLVKAEHTFRYCKFICYKNDAGIDTSGIPIGIGGQYEKTVKFFACEFINYNDALTHNNCILAHNGGITGMRLIVENCVFTTQPDYYDIRLSTTGGGDQCTAVVTGCRLTKGFRFAAGSSTITNQVWELFANNNVNVVVANTTGHDISGQLFMYNNSGLQQ